MICRSNDCGFNEINTYDGLCMGCPLGLEPDSLK